MRRAASIALAALSVALPAAELVGQRTPPDTPPAVLVALVGTWEGTGTLLGRPGSFTMEWTLGRGGFAHLSFTNAWVTADGAATPVLAAEATYLVRGDSASGVWIDDRPQRITLEAALTDSTVVTRWSAPTETGRTEYILRSPESVVVRDFVAVDGAERPFAEATYRRSSP